jgi:hypothetical protein
VGYAHDDVGDIFSRAQKLSGLEHVFTIQLHEAARVQPPVLDSQRGGHLQRRQGVRRQLGWIERNPHLAALPADQRHRGDVDHLLDGIVRLRSDAPQFEIAVPFAGQRQRQDRNVID